ncbi:CRACD-like protein isoform X1 [Rhinolophus ferrumequinum]|uniref:CRACD like n=2 Tax=Rhinolophus ferrumequinum TaxID=59479 RepID=A0A671EDP3_RHIFE|nr:CRACD-like protein isoform X1 [Rhinolophus ferrumequinum]XP_032981158.1 CRACD-like protein isoform X1 [Rhinolophus ferrumequinum]XP_032981159.1 CRACD-like protein isoform X1 [Rhinolophus ferrumequinum]
MISTRMMDFKLREAAEGLGEDSTGKKKSKFKTFKKFFGKKKRKESPSSTGSSTWKQSQAKSEVMAVESGPVGYDSEDELEESRGSLGSRALSHDSIFIPESGQDPSRPVRVFSQENVCDRIKALQLKIQCNVKMGPPPPGGLPAKRGDDAGMSSEDDGLPRSPPEMSLLHDIGPGTTIKVSLVSSSRPPSPDQLSSRHLNDAPVFPRTLDSSVAPVADFSYPPEFSSCLDNSAAKHKLLVKPRNQRSSKMRRLSSRAQSESLSDLTCTPEEEEYDEKPSPTVSSEDKPTAGQQDMVLDRGPEPGGPATMLPPGCPRVRRARLQHCPALSASAEEESTPGDNPSSRPTTPEVTELESSPAPCLESPFLPEGSLHPDPDSENQREELSLASTCPPARDIADEVVCASGDTESQLSPHIPGEDMTPPGPSPDTPVEMPSGPDRPDHNEQKEMELTLAVPSLEGEGTECSKAPAPSLPAPKSCLKHKALVASKSLSVSPTSPTSESPPEEPTPCGLDKDTTPLEPSRAELAESPQEVPEKVVREQKIARGGGEPRSVKKFSVSSGRAWPRTGHRERLGHPGPLGPAAAPSAIRLPLLKSSVAWRSEATLDDLQVPPVPQNRKLDPQEPPSPAECGSQDLGDRVASQAGPGRSPQDAENMPATSDSRPAAQEPPTCGDRSPFPVKLRSTSLSFKHRDVSSPEMKGIKRYSAEVRLEKGGLTLLSKEDKCPIGKAPTTRGARSPNDQEKGKARSSEQLGSKPPLPRKPLLQALTLPYPPASTDDSPGELDKAVLPSGPRKESRTAEKRLPRQGADKSLPPSATGPGAEGQPGPPWIAVTRQKRRGAPEQPANQQDKPGAQTLKSETGKQAKVLERAQEPMKQADFVRSKSFLMAPAKPTVDRRQGTKLCLQEGLQRGISLSHQNLAAQSAVMTEKELHQLKRASYASADQPSWMELARKKSQAWSDMPQIIK